MHIPQRYFLPKNNSVNKIYMQTEMNVLLVYVAAISIAPIPMEVTRVVATLDTKYLQTIGPVSVRTKLICRVINLCMH